MRFTKQELFEELQWFIPAFAKGVSRMFAIHPTQTAGASSRFFGNIDRAILHIEGDADEPNWEALSQTSLWRVLAAMYDYGFDGIETPETNVGDGMFADVELFILGLDGLKQYFDEDEGDIPRRCQITVTLAVARHVLDGGTPYRIDLDRPAGYLSFAEVALLADMDERSVRNAANPKLPSPLRTETIGKRSLIAVEEARRWLAGRKGFFPTKPMQEKSPFSWTVKASLELPTDIINALDLRASSRGVTKEDYLRTVLAPELKEITESKAVLAATVEANKRKGEAQ